ncbi:MULTISPECIES: hypothetical protein [Corynebacterium]|uniref:hypothetical protein n=1 Tax=Corynebacterium TaxID=1716 RepID=UPI0035B24156
MKSQQLARTAHAEERSAFVAPIFTPLLSFWLAGEHVHVSAGPMAWSIVKMVILPVDLGLLARVATPRARRRRLRAQWPWGWACKTPVWPPHLPPVT